MKIINDFGNLMYDDAEKECYYIVSATAGQTFAFVQLLDIGNPGNHHKKPFRKRYWGPFDPNHPKDSIRRIMGHGGKWPMLPGVRAVD